jgi:hypothetical protein
LLFFSAIKSLSFQCTVLNRENRSSRWKCTEFAKKKDRCAKIVLLGTQAQCDRRLSGDEARCPCGCKDFANRHTFPHL